MEESLENLLATPDKVYVRVNEDRMPDGRLIPNYFYWEDGRRCHIHRVTDIRPAHSTKAGGFGMRYTINFSVVDESSSAPPRIYTKYLFLEEDRWFMERK